MNNYSGHLLQIHSFIPMTNFCKLLHVILVLKLAIGVKNNCTRAQASLNCTWNPFINRNELQWRTHSPHEKEDHAGTIKV